MTQTKQELEATIKKAREKIGASKESDICRYLPVSTGGYMHHFTFRKLKHEDPKLLIEEINKHVCNSKKLSKVAPKPRAARGSRKRRDQLTFTKHDLERMLQMARMAGDKEMIRKLTPRKDLRTVKRELISSIRHNRIEPDLWNCYVEGLSAVEAAQAELAKV